MKKILIFIMAIIAFVWGGGVVNISHAYAYPQNLNGDPNYVIAYGHMGTGEYINRNSVKVIAKNADGIVFSVDTIMAQVLEQNGAWITPVTDVEKNTVVYKRIYNDPWMVVYQYNSRSKSWKARDLSITAGYNQWFLGIFYILGDFNRK